MKQVFVIILFTVFISCKKEEKFNPDANLTTTHWFKLDKISSDTLFSVYFPNSFTPNADGVNDDFRISGYFDMKNFIVYNRNHQIMFASYDINNGLSWDGSSNNSNTTEQMGVYSYLLNIKDFNGENYSYNGVVMLYK